MSAAKKLRRKLRAVEARIEALEEQNDHLLTRLRLAGDMIDLTPDRPAR